jgi:hypothetical protein
MMARAPRNREAIVVLLGVTAGGRERRSLAGFFAGHGLDPLIPSLAQWRGLRACCDALVRYWAGRVTPSGYRRVHVLAYISGGLIFRQSGSRLDLRNLGSVVYVRSPLQEQVPSRLLNGWGQWGLLLLPRGKMLLDLAAADFAALPYPGSHRPQGLLVEAHPSRLALRLGITADAVPPRTWEADGMLPEAGDVRTLPISHDEAYDSELLLSEVLHFARNGCFQSREASLT